MSEHVPALFGLVSCGGNSSRMGTDKSKIIYHAKPQCYHVYEMLTAFCEKVFISSNRFQATDMDKAYASLTDLPCYENSGPIGGLLTAFTHYPAKDFLMIGCDYPFLKATDIEAFLFAQITKRNTAAFYNVEDGLYEPLLAFYRHDDFVLLTEMLRKGNYSLQYYLREKGAAKFYPDNKQAIKSVDTKEEFLAAIAILETGNYNL